MWKLTERGKRYADSMGQIDRPYKAILRHLSENRISSYEEMEFIANGQPVATTINLLRERGLVEEV
jgi:hypothetical protein